MNDCDALLREVIAQAESLGIPVSKEIVPRVSVNRRAVNRFGRCKSEKGKYYIEVALRVAEGPEESCRAVLAHETLHTCYGCQNHGRRWKEYAERMGAAYGYVICRTATNEKLGVEEAGPCRYVLRCESCGAEFRRYRASSLVRFPERYRWGCGGKIHRVI